MNKKLLFTLIGIVLVITAAITYVAMTPNNTAAPSPKSSTPTPKANKPQSPNEASQAQPGTYTVYSEEAINSTPGTKLLFFHAPWCPQCRQIESSIEKDGIPSGVTVFKVDYDSNQSLRQKYGVTIQTTFVKLNDAGEKQASYTAYQEPDFSSVRRELLP